MGTSFGFPEPNFDSDENACLLSSLRGFGANSGPRHDLLAAQIALLNRRHSCLALYSPGLFARDGLGQSVEAILGLHSKGLRHMDTPAGDKESARVGNILDNSGKIGL
jgi:hypothetical protein